MTQIIIFWIICGLISLCVTYVTYKNTPIYIEQLFLIGIAIFLLGPISLLTQLIAVAIMLIKYLIK